MEFIKKLAWTIRHLSPESLTGFMDYVGARNLYIVIFCIVFAETGLVVWPFLPGDSLLFAIGVICADPASPLSLGVIVPVLLAAVLLGDNTNYWIGRRLGPAVFKREDSRLLNKKHLGKAQAFYEKYGAKTIILARFVPVVRTFAPFVAGIGRMNYGRFLLFSVLGGVFWVTVCITAGYKLAQVTFIRKHFELVVLIIIAISVLPMVVEFVRARRHARHQARKGFVVTPTGTATTTTPSQGQSPAAAALTDEAVR
jgi:membrane-associated protein